MLNEDRRADGRIAMASRSAAAMHRGGAPAWHPAWPSGRRQRCRSMPTAVTHPESPLMSVGECAQREHLQGE
jgi:hypothetical protein